MLELLSLRKKPIEDPDQFEYSKTSQKFKNQSSNVILDLLNNAPFCYDINDIIKEYCKFKGIFCYPDKIHDLRNLTNLLNDNNDEDYLDLIDCCCIVAYYRGNCTEIYKNSIDDLNIIFRMNGIGYEVNEGKLILIFNPKIHEEIIRPSLKIIHNSLFKVANEELILSFDKFKQKDNSGAILSASNAVESTIKVIAKELKIKIDDSKPISVLIKKLCEGGFFDTFLDSQINSLTNLLQSTSNARNATSSAHGSEGKTVNTDDELVKYAIDSAASNILYLIRRFERIKK
ncbi:MAG: hypothetical protein KRP56_06400 [Candidatus Methanogranum gryphiswaldense]|nr:MAG: hypothetical protein KRP56_06400 [Candidatus Methanogranum sp. U3.2.1]